MRDVRDAVAYQSLLRSLIEKHGAIHVLVNNAGRDDRHRVEDVTPAFWDERLARRRGSVHASGARPRMASKRQLQTGQTSGLTSRGGRSPRSRPSNCSAAHRAIRSRHSCVTPAV